MKGDYHLTPEQEEMRTRGLRILARWIASVYLRDRALAAKADAEGVTGGHATQEGQDRTLIPAEDRDEAALTEWNSARHEGRYW